MDVKKRKSGKSYYSWSISMYTCTLSMYFTWLFLMGGGKPAIFKLGWAAVQNALFDPPVRPCALMNNAARTKHSWFHCSVNMFDVGCTGLKVL